MPIKLQKHPVLGIFHICIHKVELIQCAFQHALKAFHMSASEVKKLKNRNNLVGSEESPHIARSHSHYVSSMKFQSICQQGYSRAHFKIS